MKQKFLEKRSWVEKTEIEHIEGRGGQNIAFEGHLNGQSGKRGEHVNGASAFPEPLKEEKRRLEANQLRDPWIRGSEASEPGLLLPWILKPSSLIPVDGNLRAARL